MPRILTRTRRHAYPLDALYNTPDDGTGAGGGGGAPAGGGQGSGTDTGGASGAPDKGYPEGTPVADMTAEQKASYYQAQARKWEDQARGKSDPQTDYLKGLKSAADKAAELENATKSEAQKAQDEAVAAAKKETREATLREAANESVKALLEGALKLRGHKDPAKAVERANLSAFVKDGAIDHDAIVEHASELAGNAGGGGRQGPDLGQGNRGRETGVRAADAGRAEAERRYGKKQTTTTS